MYHVFVPSVGARAGEIPSTDVIMLEVNVPENVLSLSSVGFGADPLAGNGYIGTGPYNGLRVHIAS
jgi:hypothetical protein